MCPYHEKKWITTYQSTIIPNLLKNVLLAKYHKECKLGKHCTDVQKPRPFGRTYHKWMDR